MFWAILPSSVWMTCMDFIFIQQLQLMAWTSLAVCVQDEHNSTGTVQQVQLMTTWRLTLVEPAFSLSHSSLSLSVCLSLSLFVYKSQPLTTHAIRSQEISPSPLAARYCYLKHKRGVHLCWQYRLICCRNQIETTTINYNKSTWKIEPFSWAVIWFSSWKKKLSRVSLHYSFLLKYTQTICMAAQIYSVCLHLNLWAWKKVTVVQKINKFMVWRNNSRQSQKVT